MYIVTITNSGESIQIHNSKEKLKSGVITTGINTIDSFQFTMLPSNAGFEHIHDYTTLVKVLNTNRNRYEFYGRVLYSDNDMDSNGAIKKEVICESYFGFLCDSQQEYVAERNWTVGGLLQHIINTHNSQVEDYKQFTLGEVTVTDANDNVYCGIQRENTWEALKKKLIDTLGGEFRFRVENDVLYIDYLVEIGETSSTEIAMSRNMKSITCEKDPSEIVTRLIPLGCKLTDTDEEGNEVETEYRLDISSVNNGKKYIDDDRAIERYGIRVATVEFDDVTVASTLLAKGEKWLEENNRIQVSYTVTALDLSLIGLDTDDFEVCNYHVIRNPLLSINDKVRIIKKSIDICEETQTTIELGDNFEKLSGTMKKQSSAMKLMASHYVTNQRFENLNKKTSTRIDQTEEKIALVVGAEGIVNGETKEVQGAILIEAINNEVLAKIAAERLDIEGKKLNIKVASTNITGELTAEQINADGIKADDVEFTNGSFSGDLSTNIILLENKRIFVDTDDGGEITKIGVSWSDEELSGYKFTVTATADSPVPEDAVVEAFAYFTTGPYASSSYAAGYAQGTIKKGETTTTVSGTFSNLISQYGIKIVYQNTISFSASALVVAIDSSFMPAEDSKYVLGTATKKWSDIYSATGTINTSDEREKNSISEISQKYSDMFYKLSPVMYKLNKGTSGRYHIGFSAQAVEKAMSECGIDSKDFAGLIKSPQANGDFIYGLRYEEFIALAVLQIQKLNERILELEARVGGEECE